MNALIYVIHTTAAIVRFIVSIRYFTIQKLTTTNTVYYE